MGGEKRREHPRFAAEVLVEVTAPRGTLRGRTRNVSRGGLCLELDAPLDPGDVVAIEMALLFDDDKRSEPLALPARVVWCTPIDRVHQVGAQFARLSPNQLAYLDLFLRYIDAAPATPAAGRAS